MNRSSSLDQERRPPRGGLRQDLSTRASVHVLGLSRPKFPWQDRGHRFSCLPSNRGSSQAPSPFPGRDSSPAYPSRMLVFDSRAGILSLVAAALSCGCAGDRTHKVGSAASDRAAGPRRQRGEAPRLAGPVRFLDRVRDRAIGAGDELVLPFTMEVLAPSFRDRTPSVFRGRRRARRGSGLEGGPRPNEITIVLGPGATLRPQQGFAPSTVGPGAPSGLGLLAEESGAAIRSARSNAELASAPPVDVLADLVPWEQHLGSDPVVAFAIGDIDRDGDLDIVSAHTSQPVRIFLGQGGGKFDDGTLLLAAREVTALALVDLDRDYDLDLSRRARSRERRPATTVTGAWNAPRRSRGNVRVPLPSAMSTATVGSTSCWGPTAQIECGWGEANAASSRVRNSGPPAPGRSPWETWTATATSISSTSPVAPAPRARTCCGSTGSRPLHRGRSSAGTWRWSAPRDLDRDGDLVRDRRRSREPRAHERRSRTAAPRAAPRRDSRMAAGPGRRRRRWHRGPRAGASARRVLAAWSRGWPLRSARRLAAGDGRSSRRVRGPRLGRRSRSMPRDGDGDPARGRIARGDADELALPCRGARSRRSARPRSRAGRPRSRRLDRRGLCRPRRPARDALAARRTLRSAARLARRRRRCAGRDGSRRSRPRRRRLARHHRGRPRRRARLVRGREGARLSGGPAALRRARDRRARRGLRR